MSTPSFTPDPTSPGTEGEEMREAIARALCKQRGLNPEGKIAVIRLRSPYLNWELFLEDADALLAGPLARLHSDLTAAREERDTRVDAAVYFQECLDHRLALNRVDAVEANLIALAKMYGEACGELAKARHERSRTDRRIRGQRAALRENWEIVEQRIGPRAHYRLWQFSQKQSLRARAAESEAITLRERAAKLEEGLRECLNQLEYQHEKFGGTGSGDTVMHRTRAILSQGAGNA